jgi:histidinol-phosphatase
MPDDLQRELERDLEFALELADAADAYTLPRFERQDFALGWKDDRTEVTEADRGTESLLAERILAARPDHALFGEEHGTQGAEDAEWCWVIDPIDGTSGFVRGIPVWATLIALTHRERGAMVGVVSAPALGRRWWAAHGLGSFAGGRRCQVSDIADLADAQLCVTFSPGWEELGLMNALVALLGSARRARGFGDFWQHCLVAEGALDVAVDAIGLGLYDVVAPQLIVEEAGGRFTNPFGEDATRSAISSNPHVHTAVLTRLGL